MDEQIDPLPPGTVAPDFTVSRTPQRFLPLYRLLAQSVAHSLRRSRSDRVSPLVSRYARLEPPSAQP